MRRKFFCGILLLAAALTLGAAESKWQKNVRHTKQGEVYVDRIPQVAQRKNFCAPASVEMVLRYYKNRVTQRLLGRSFETDKETGTYTNELIKEFEQGRLKDFSIKPLYRMTVKERNELVSAYSRVGRLSGAGSTGKGKKGKKAKNSGGSSSSGDVFSRMDPNVAVPIFARMRRPLQKMMAQEIVRYVDLGQPLLWCVHMNFDPASRAAGGHMRLIVGYQKSGNTVTMVIYRDPWGKKPQLKKMALSRAAVMTMELLLIEPRPQPEGTPKTAE